MDILEALWRRDYSTFLIGQAKKELFALMPPPPKSGIEAMIDAHVRPTHHNIEERKRLCKSIEDEMRVIVRCQKALGEDHSQALKDIEKFKAIAAELTTTQPLHPNEQHPTEPN